MKISLVERGGWSAGIAPREQVVDLNAIDEESAREGHSLADKLLANPPDPGADNTRARDEMEFTLSIDDGQQTKTFSSKSLAMTREFADLMSWLKRRLAEQRRRQAEET